MATKTYRDQIATYLKKTGRSLSPDEARGLFGCRDLSTAVRDLKARGLNIVTEYKKDFKGIRYARYSLKPTERLSRAGIR